MDVLLGCDPQRAGAFRRAFAVLRTPYIDLKHEFLKLDGERTKSFWTQFYQTLLSKRLIDIDIDIDYFLYFHLGL